ncbi:membrane protein [Conyzicola lurida]|uniref:Membrane protein n=1 Tax=Conyzicola lurida TaxID=1172621 RepID=A0A841ALA2_9MICO|nr:membrane protein [Conyzicola lurida]
MTIDGGGDHPTSRGLPRAAFRHAATRAWHGFMLHRGIDSAAALTYFATLAIFPGALVVVSAFAISSDRQRAVDSILAVVGDVGTDSTVETLRAPLHEFLSLTNPGIALAAGLLLLLWTLSAYATAFGRAMNSVYEVQEGRQFWKFRGLMMLVTLVLMVAFGAIIVILLVTPRVIDAIGDDYGFSEPWMSVWNVGKWPLLAVLAVLVVAVLYYFTPNVRHSRLRWVSWGAVFAIVVWALAAAGFAVYVATVGQYERVYGWLGGGIVLLLWLYISNLVLVLGAEVDAEVVRLRQLSVGIPAEEVIQLPLRDTARNLLLARQRASDVHGSIEIREDAEKG